MSRPVRWLLQALAYGLFLAPLAYFSNQPVMRFLDEDHALLRLSFSHAGSPISECRQLSQEELNELPPNMRRPTECPRERVSLLLVMRLDGATLFRDQLAPSGFWKDGETSINREFEIPAGTHHIEVAMRDSRRETGFDYTMSKTLRIEPRDNIVIGFDPNAGGFRFAGGRP